MDYQDIVDRASENTQNKSGAAITEMIRTILASAPEVKDAGQGDTQRARMRFSDGAPLPRSMTYHFDNEFERLGFRALTGDAVSYIFELRRIRASRPL